MNLATVQFQHNLGRDAHTILPLISLSLVPLVLSAWVLYRELFRANEPAGFSRRVACLGALGLVTSLAVIAGLAHSANQDWLPNVPAWQGWGLYPEKDPLAPLRAQPASREERAERICRFWNTISASRSGKSIPQHRDDLTGIDPELWAVPGEGGPNWLYLVRDGSFVLIEPYAINGEQLATSNGEEARQVRKEELQAVSQLRGKGL